MAGQMEGVTRGIAIAGSALLLVVIVELVRRRRLKEEYSVLWVLIALVVLFLSIFEQVLYDVTDAVGAVAASSTLFFFGLVFLLLMVLHFSVRISMLERKVTNLVQEWGIAQAERDEPERGPAGGE